MTLSTDWGNTHTHTPCRLCSICLPELITLGLWGPAWSLDDPACWTVCTLSTPTSLPATASKHPPHGSICSQRSDRASLQPQKRANGACSRASVKASCDNYHRRHTRPAKKQQKQKKHDNASQSKTCFDPLSFPSLGCFVFRARHLLQPLSLHQIRQRGLFFPQQIKCRRGRASKREKMSPTAGNKNSRPGLSYNNMLLLDSITSPKPQVLPPNFLSRSIHRSFFSHSRCLPLCLSSLLPTAKLPVAPAIWHSFSSPSSSSSRYAGPLSSSQLVFWSPLPLWYAPSFHLPLFLPLS